MSKTGTLPTASTAAAAERMARRAPAPATICFPIVQLDTDPDTGKIKPVSKRVCDPVEAPRTPQI